MVDGRVPTPMWLEIRDENGTGLNPICIMAWRVPVWAPWLTSADPALRRPCDSRAQLGRDLRRVLKLADAPARPGSPAKALSIHCAPSEDRRCRRRSTPQGPPDYLLTHLPDSRTAGLKRRAYIPSVV